ncbi:MAG: transcriptional regulator [Methylotenera sp.]|nr:MAG: transcriptional regulator [Methylotenera sp.]
MHTVIETDIFTKYAADVWDEATYTEFVSYIATNPMAADIIPSSGGCRKVRWTRQGMGKSGGVRVIYFFTVHDCVVLLIVYAKSKFENLPTHILKKLKDEVENE